MGTRGRKASPKSKLSDLKLRLDGPTLNRIRGLAKLYAGGNVSLWMRHAGVNAPRRHLTKKR